MYLVLDLHPSDRTGPGVPELVQGVTEIRRERRRDFTDGPG